MTQTKIRLKQVHEHDNQFTVLVFPVTGFETSRTHLGCGRTIDLQHEGAPAKF